MKSKIESAIDKQDKDLDYKIKESNMEDDVDEEVDAGGPEVARSKGSKIIIIAVSAIMISIMLYFMFFKGGEQAPVDSEGLQPVPAQSDFVSEAPAAKDNLEDLNAILGNSLNQDKKDISASEIGDVPSIPELPKIFGEETGDDGLLPNLIALDKDKKKKDGGPKVVGEEGQNNQNQDGQSQDKGEFSNPNDPANQGNSQNQGNNGPTPAGGSSGGGAKPGASPIIAIAGSAGPANSVGYENNIINLNKDPMETLEVSEPKIKSRIIKDKSSTLVQGKIINAVLETAINTEFDGEVRGIISRDVFAESGKHVLIPRGSRIYGKYASTIQRGQARVTINWSRLIRPDGVDADITFSAADQFGRAGIEGEVDNKYGSVIANSILTSVLAIGGAVAADKLSNTKSSTTTTDPKTGTSTTTGSASSQAIQDLSKTVIDIVGEVVGNTLNSEPVIRIAQGTKITIVVNSDMDLPQFVRQ